MFIALSGREGTEFILSAGKVTAHFVSSVPEPRGVWLEFQDGAVRSMT